MKDKVIAITGAQHGSGAATAKAFAAQGAAVLLHFLRVREEVDRRNRAGAESASSPGEGLYRARRAISAGEVLGQIRGSGGRAEAWEANLSRPENIPRLLVRREATLGPVQVLVNHAAHWEADSFLPPEAEPANFLVELWTERSRRLTADSHDRHFAVNRRAAALLMSGYFRRYVQRGQRWGQIISVSIEGAYCFPGEVSYGASKAALEAYSRSAAREFGKFGITVNVVAPDAAQRGWITPELERQLLAMIPLGRLGLPENVGDVVVFLASQQARWLTGQLVHVGDGATI